MSSLSGEVEKSAGATAPPDPGELLARLNREISNSAVATLVEWLDARRVRLEEQVLSDLDPRSAGKVDAFRYIIKELTESREEAGR